MRSEIKWLVVVFLFRLLCAVAHHPFARMSERAYVHMVA